MPGAGDFTISMEIGWQRDKHEQYARLSPSYVHLRERTTTE